MFCYETEKTEYTGMNICVDRFAKLVATLYQNKISHSIRRSGMSMCVC